MRLNLLLPDVKPNQLQLPKQCKREGCKGKRFYPRQAVEKKIVDGKFKSTSMAIRVRQLWLQLSSVSAGSWSPTYFASSDRIGSDAVRAWG